MQRNTKEEAMSTVKANFVDDFLEGSYTLYNYNPRTSKSFLIYPQIAGFQKIGPNYYNEVEFGNVYMLNYTTEGEGVFITNGGKRVVKKGDLIFIHNYFHHILRPDKGHPWSFAFLHIFENEMVSKIYQSIVAKEGFVMEDVSEELVFPYIDKVSQELSSHLEGYESRCSLLIYQLLLGLSIESDRRKRADFNPSIDAVINYIKENYVRPLPLKDIIEQTNYSKNHLERMFKMKMNMTIQEYIFYLRLTRSEELLVSTDLTLKEIAEQVGLSEYRSLYHMYRNALGITPEEYRRKSGEYKSPENQ